MPQIEYNDADLVAESLRGSREAFGEIVARYQTLICSLAYSATGSLAQSEDLSQETFLTAWQQLAKLQEPAKLRSWLCGIVKNLSRRTHRDAAHEPTHGAEPLETVHDSAALEPHPLQQTITREEEGILWRSLEQIPETYREPLILFYREHESVERVAQTLELSEEAVRQRLTRGRKLLHEQVLSFVEGALEKTNPGKVFTFAVLTALPVAATTAKAATVGTALAKGGATAKSVLTVGALGGMFAMLGAAYVGLRAQADEAKSPREHKFMLQTIGIRMVVGVLTFAAFFAFKKIDFSQAVFLRECAGAALFFTMVVGSHLLFDFFTRRQRQIQIEEGTWNEAEWRAPRRETDPLLNQTNTRAKWKSHFKAVKFLAFAFVMYAILCAAMPWSQRPLEALGLTTFLVLMLFLAVRRWKDRPRYQGSIGSWNRGFSAFWGLMTLWIFNNDYFSAHSKLTGINAITPTTAVLFNVVVVAAYALFIWFVFWKQKRAEGSSSI